MTPAARLAATIEIVGLLNETGQPADRLMRDYFRARRFAGSKDRRAIAERVFGIWRHHAHFSHRMGGHDPRRLGIASVLAEGGDPETFFTGGYGPAPLTEVERAAIAQAPSDPPLWVQGEYPQFLEGELLRAFGSNLLLEMAAFQERAPVDLRVNTLKTARESVLKRLIDDGFDCFPLRPSHLDGATGTSPSSAAREGEGGLCNAIRCEAGANLTAHPLYESGAFEIQDAAAQIAAALAEAKPGMRVLDLAAGAGGKSLALAAAMQNRGEIVACDVRRAALAELERRAARAGVSIIRTHLLGELPSDTEIGGPFDLVFLDAPCSGSGTWRRQPEAKWRLTQARLAELMALQDRLLDQGARLTGTGGRLIYATCSILPCENEDRAAQFVAKYPGFRRLPPDFRASPHSTGTDGFYAARFVQA